MGMRSLKPGTRKILKRVRAGWDKLQSRQGRKLAANAIRRQRKDIGRHAGKMAHEDHYHRILGINR